MTPAEAATLLAMAAAYDGRMRLQNTAEIAIQAQAWAAALDERITFDDGRRLVIDHYAASREVIMPANINEAWWRRRNELMRTHVDPLPSADPDDVTAYLAELRANRAAHGYDPTKYADTFDYEDRSIDPKVQAAMKRAIESTKLKWSDK